MDRFLTLLAFLVCCFAIFPTLRLYAFFGENIDEMSLQPRTDRVFVPENRENAKILELFWEVDSPFCSFNPSDFEVEEDGKTIKFSCSEQYFMYKKSLFVNDQRSANLVLQQTDPGTMKYIGRSLNMTKDDLERWSTASQDVMYRACVAKFSQNQYHRLLLFRTRDMVLVEASPYDKIWGIGLDKHDPRAEDPATWQGTNWLGVVLDRVRDELWEDPKFREDREKVEKEDLKTRIYYLEHIE